MKGLIPQLQLFFKRNGSTILTCLGAIGVIATAVSAAKATPEALWLLEKSKERKGEELTKLETLQTVAPAYIPTVAVAGTTIACVFGANVLSNRQQAALASAYTVLGQAYNTYRNKVRDVLGEESDKRVMGAIAEGHITDESVALSDGKMRFMEFNSLQIFESTMEDVYKAEDYMNKTLNERGYVLLGEFYEALGTENVIEDDYAVGWTKAILNNLNVDHIAFVHDIITTNSGEECCVITPVIDPIPVYNF